MKRLSRVICLLVAFMLLFCCTASAVSWSLYEIMLINTNRKAVYASDWWQVINRDMIPDFEHLLTQGNYIMLVDNNYNLEIIDCYEDLREWKNDEGVTCVSLLFPYVSASTLAGTTCIKSKYSCDYDKKTGTYGEWYLANNYDTPQAINCFNGYSIVDYNIPLYSYNPNSTSEFDDPSDKYNQLLFEPELPPNIDSSVSSSIKLFDYREGEPLTSTFGCMVSAPFAYTVKLQNLNDFSVVGSVSNDIAVGHIHTLSDFGLSPSYYGGPYLDPGDYMFSLYDFEGRLLGSAAFSQPQLASGNGQADTSIYMELLDCDSYTYSSRVHVHNGSGKSVTLKVVYIADGISDTMLDLSDVYYNKNVIMSMQSVQKDFNYYLRNLNLLSGRDYAFALYDSDDNLISVKFYSMDDYYVGSDEEDDDSGLILDISGLDINGVFEFVELPDDPNVLDYIVYFFTNAKILFSGIGHVIVQFSESLSIYDILNPFFSFLPLEFSILIPLCFAVAIALRVLGR